MELLIVIVLIYAAHRAVEDSKSALRKSRGAYTKSAKLRFPKAGKSRRLALAARHDAGFWLGQAAQGFPAARHGLAAGWHAGRQAQAEGRAVREKTKAEHLETRVRLIPEIREHLRRQNEALEQIKAEREAGGGNLQPVMAPPSWAPGVAGWPGPAGTNGESPAWPGGAPGKAETVPDPGEGGEGNGEGSPAAPAVAGPGPERRACAACGNPEGGDWGPLVLDAGPLYPGDAGGPRLVHKAHFEDEADGFYGRPHEPAPVPDDAPGQQGETSEGSGEGTAAPETEPSTPPAEGEPSMAGERVTGTMAPNNAFVNLYADTGRNAGGVMPASADTTYDGVLASMSAEMGNAEQRAAEQQQAGRQASSLSDQMQALEVDSATLSAMADHLDAHDAATKAQQRVQETAEAVEAAMKRGHAGLSEAHKDAPVAAAKKEFYAA